MGGQRYGLVALASGYDPQTTDGKGVKPVRPVSYYEYAVSQE